jgi:hypothetical protein
MPTLQDMTTSLEDAKFFNDEIEKIVRGQESGYDINLIRRYFRAYLHCWKAVLYFVRNEKGLNERQWKKWSDGWQEKFLDEDGIKSMKELRETRDYDTHKGTIVVSGEVAAGLFPLVVFVDPESKAKRELVTLTRKGLEVVKALVATHAEGP